METISSVFWSFFLPSSILNDEVSENPTSSNKQPSELAAMINKSILSMYQKCLSEDGRYVDYRGIGSCEEFKQYQKDVNELVQVQLEKLTNNERKAFFLNIYNALVIHSYVVYGIPYWLVKKLVFYQTVCYRIGPHVYSLDDIEHGILRCNRRHPAIIFGFPFRNSDARRQFECQPLDPRVHFGMVCGAKSCPPIRIYSPENVDKALDLATSAYCNQDDNVHIDIEKKTVTLSQLFQWYGRDFAEDDKGLLTWISRFLNQEKQTLLKIILDSKDYSISYLSYNWNLNSKDD